MKKRLLLTAGIAMGILMFMGCSDVYQTLADGKNAVVNGFIHPGSIPVNYAHVR